MGVHGLWKLLGISAERIDLRRLRTRRLAIDVSIWLTQFIKAMRDPDGKLLPNAHIIGVLRRLCVLLFHGIRPVFVFDGPAPRLKKRTIAQRRRFRTKNRNNMQRAAERILLQQLKVKNIAELKKSLAAGKDLTLASAAAEAAQAVDGGGGGVVDMTTGSDDDDDDDWELDVGDDDGDVYLPADPSEIDAATIAALPGSLRRRVLWQQQQQEHFRNQAKFQRASSDPNAYSSLQLEKFLESSETNKQMRELRAEIGGGGKTNHLGVQSQRIASNPEREYVFAHTSKGDDPNSGGFFGSSSSSSSKPASSLGLGTRAQAAIDQEQKRREQLNRREAELRRVREQQKSSGGSVNYMEMLVKGAPTDAARVFESSSVVDAARAAEHMAALEAEVKAKQSVMQSKSVSGKLRRSFSAPVPLTAGDDDEDEEDEVEEEDDVEEVDDEELNKPGQWACSACTFVNDPEEGSCTVCGVTRSSEQVEGPQPWNCPTCTLHNFASAAACSACGAARPGQQTSSPSPVPQPRPARLSVVDRHWPCSACTFLNKDTALRCETCGTLRGVGLMSSEVVVSVSAPAPEVVVLDEEPENPALEMAELSDLSDLSSDDDELVVYKDPVRRVVEEEEVVVEEPKVVEEEPKVVEEEPEVVEEEPEVVEEEEVVVEEPEVIEVEDGQMEEQPEEQPDVVEQQPEVVELEDEPMEEPPEQQPEEQPTTIESMLPTAEQTSSGIFGSAASSLLADFRTPMFLREAVTPSAAPASTPASAPVSTPAAAPTAQRFMPYIAPGVSMQGYPTLDRASLDEAAARLNAAHVEATKEISQLQTEQRDYQRDAEVVTEDMVREVKLLLRLFGVPYIVAPAEAEAQCAELERLGLVDATVTDDSDTFLFGSQHIYRNMFQQKQFTESFTLAKVAQDLGLNRERLIGMAMLLGSDYTNGIRGIGVVNAIEIMAAFASDVDGARGVEGVVQGLTEFREWVYSSTPASNKKPAGLAAEARDDPEAVRAYHKAIFKYKHRNVKANWEVSTHFPDAAVVNAYIRPLVDDNADPFTWGRPDVPAIALFLNSKLGWDQERIDRQLKPVIESLLGSRTRQPEIGNYFLGPVMGKFAHIESLRIQNAVYLLTGRRLPLAERLLEPKRKRKRADSSEAGSESSKKQKGKSKKKKKKSKKLLAKRSTPLPKKKNGKQEKSKASAAAAAAACTAADDSDDDLGLGPLSSSSDSDEQLSKTASGKRKATAAVGEAGGAAKKTKRMAEPLLINRAPVLTLWACVCSLRQGHSFHTGLSIGRALANVFAKTKGKRLGILDDREHAARGHERRWALYGDFERDYAKTSAPVQETEVTVMGRRIRLRTTPEGPCAAKPEGGVYSGAQAQVYIERAFGDRLQEVCDGMEALANVFPDGESLDRHAYHLYKVMRPKVADGVAGWNQKSAFDPTVLAELADKWRRHYESVAAAQAIVAARQRSAPSSSSSSSSSAQ